MKAFRGLLILLTTITLIGTSCKKLGGLLNGDVTCTIDGRRWTSFSDDFKLPEAKCQISNNGEEVFITATNTNTSEKIGILVSTPGAKVTVGKYILNSDRYLLGSYYQFDTVEFITGNGYEGEVEITSIDEAKSRIRGTFHFSTKHKTSNQVVNVTGGKFNVAFTIHQ